MKKWHYLLYPGDLRRIQANLRKWSDSINRKMGLPAGSFTCLGFLDGTARPICRVGGHSLYQESLYDGHHHMHAFDYQALSTPDGIIVMLFGPVSGRRTDAFMVKQSGIAGMIDQYCWDEEGKQYFVYADAGYTSDPFILAPHSQPLPHTVQSYINYKWAKERVCAEWNFGRVVNLFQTLDFFRMQKVLRSRVGLWYPVCVLLTNCETAMYGNQTTYNHPDLEPPGLDNYLVEQDEEFAKCVLQTYGPDPDVVPLYGSEKWHDMLQEEQKKYFRLERLKDRQQI